MNRCIPIVLCLTLAALRLSAQVPVTAGSYAQDFGNADVAAWVNNSTYPGWYQSQASFAGHVNVSGSAPANSGGFYTYECNGANDQKIGSRGSGSATLVRYGVVLRNQTGAPIFSLRVSYRGYQLSLAQNGNTVNRTTFDYVVSPSIPGIAAGATAAVPALNFTQLQNSSVAGANQINGYPCTQSAFITGCIALSTPLANGSYILLRWSDVDDPSNDHHMAIDDVMVDFDLTGNGCAVLLPVELLEFNAKPEGRQVRLEWVTATEHDNDHFVVERSSHGLDFEEVSRVPGAGNSTQRLVYSVVDLRPLENLSYYRLRQVDIDGTSHPSAIVQVVFGAPVTSLTIVPSISEDGLVRVDVNEAALGARYDILDAAGSVLRSGRIDASSFPLDLGGLGAGCYLLRTERGAVARVVLTMR